MSCYQFIQIFNPQRPQFCIYTDFVYAISSFCYSSFSKGVEATLFSSFCQPKMIDKTLVKVFCNIGVTLLFRCSLLPFKCCDFKVYEWSISKRFLSKQSSVKHFFTSFAFVMKRLFRVMVFEMVTSCLSVFKLDARSTIDFAIRSGDWLESKSFVPT